MTVDKFVENLRPELPERGARFAVLSTRNLPVTEIPIRFRALHRVYLRFRGKPLGQPRQLWAEVHLCISQAA